MALTSGIIQNLLGGVSQQPIVLRHPTQLHEQRNMVTSEVEGLIKRPPAEYYDYLGDSIITDTDAFFHTINRDPTERYIVILTSGAVQVYDIINKEFKTVNTPDGVLYLSATDSTTAFKAVTVADFTFIVNREIEVDTLSDLSSWVDELFTDVVVKQGHYSTTYNIISEDDGVIGTYTTPASTDTGAEAAIATDQIAIELADAVDAGTGTHGFTADAAGSAIRVTMPDDQGVTVSDGLGGNGLQVLHRSVQSFSDLPSYGLKDKTLEITGDPGTEFDNYYVVSLGPTGGWSSLTWTERVAPEIEYKLDPATMPHVLVRNADGTFTFEQATWSDRAAGDLSTNPWPSFVGQTISDVFFFKNRLGLVSGESIVLSEIGEYFNFFRTTVTQLLDSDPIDATSTTNQVATLRHVEMAKGRLFAFSDSMMFELEGDPLTPNTAALNMVANVACKRNIGPVTGGFAFYLPFDRGTEYSGIHEIIPDGSEEDYVITDVTEHVPRLIAGEISSMAFSELNNTLYVQAVEDSRKNLYAYKTHWADKAEGREKVISAWAVWDFGTDIVHISVIEESLYILFFDDTTNRLTLTRVDVRDGIFEEDGWDWKILLDFRVARGHADVSSVFSGGNTTFTLPFRWDDADVQREIWVVDKAQDTVPRLTPTSSDGDTGQVVFNGQDLTAGDLLFGLEYDAKAVFSLPVVRTRDNVPVSDGELYVLWWAVNYAKSLRVRGKIEPHESTTANDRGYTQSITVSKFGGLKSGQLRFPVRRSTKDQSFDILVINDRPYPSNFINASWAANLVRRHPQ